VVSSQMAGADDRCLYLLSSNASSEYVKDIVEVLALPFNCVQHFRYQLKWLDPDLLDLIVHQRSTVSGPMVGCKVVVCYLFQTLTKENGVESYHWESIYPVRSGILEEAIKTGDSPVDVAHFYFKVDQYLQYDKEAIDKIMNQLENHRDRHYAFQETIPVDVRMAALEESQTAFYETCELIDANHLRLCRDDQFIAPVFCYIGRIKSSKGIAIEPVYDQNRRKSNYQLSEGSAYYFEFETYLTTDKLTPTIRLETDSNIFSTPSSELKASSRYDKETWTLVSKLLECDAWTNLSFYTESNSSDPDIKPLDIDIEFTIKICRRMLFRYLGVSADFAFALGTTVLVIAKLVPTWTWWWLPVFVLFPIWAVCGIVAKLWRG